MTLPSALLVLIILHGGQTSTDKVQSKLQAMYDRANELKIKKNVPGLVNFLNDTRTPDYFFLAKSHNQSLKEVIQEMTAVMTIVDKVSKATVHIDHLEVGPLKAVATTTTLFTFITRPMSDHHQHVLSERVVGQDTWIRTASGWKLKESKSTSEHFFRDGRPAPIR